MAGITLNNPNIGSTINPTNEILPVRTSSTTFGDSNFFDNGFYSGVYCNGDQFFEVDQIGNRVSIGQITGQNFAGLQVTGTNLVQNVSIGNFGIIGTDAPKPAIKIDAINERIEIKGTDTIMNPSFSPNPSSFYLKFWSTDQNQYFYIHLERQ
jgi:hypothetical protein